MRLSTIACLALAACTVAQQSTTTPGASDPLGADALAADAEDRGGPRSTLTLTGATQVAWGTTGVVHASGAGPGETVYLVRGATEGPGPCPGVIGGNCLGVTAPVANLGSVVADAGGVATFALPLPPTGPDGFVVPLQSVLVRGLGGADSVLSNVLNVELVAPGPELSAPVDPVLFVDAPAGCSVTLPIALDSVGADPVTVDSLLVAGTGFALESSPPLPATLPPAGRMLVDVTFTPDADGLFLGQLIATSDDPMSPLRIDLSGSGDAAALCAGTMTAPITVVAEHDVADVAFLLDTTCSMSGLVNALTAEFLGIAGELRTVVPDLTFGVASFDDYNYVGMGATFDKPFHLVHQQTTDEASVQAAVAAGLPIHSGADMPESGFEALLQASVGPGYDQNCNGLYDSSDDVLPFRSGAGDAFGGAVAGTYNGAVPGTGDMGGLGFRSDARALVVYATDAEMRDPLAGYPTPGGCLTDASSAHAVAGFQALDARAVGVVVGGTMGTLSTQMVDFANQTGSVADLDGDGDTEPAVVGWTSGDPAFRRAVVDTVVATLNAATFAKVEVEVVSDPAGVFLGTEPLQYTGVASGTPLDFTVTVDGTLVGPAAPGAVAVDLRLEADDTFTLGTLQIYVVP